MEIEKFYNVVAWFYPLVDLFLKVQKKSLVKEVNNLEKGHILEIGVGTGSHLSLYKSHHITGIDISLHMLWYARKKNSNTELLKMNAESLKFNNSTFDYVVISHAIAVVNNPEKVIKEAYRVLKPGGKLLILNHFTPDNFMKYIDRVFNCISGFFCLRSFFSLSNLKALHKFSKKKEINLGLLSYYKLLVFNKN